MVVISKLHIGTYIIQTFSICMLYNAYMHYIEYQINDGDMWPLAHFLYVLQVLKHANVLHITNILTLT